jgi:hypothetical protein
MRRTLVLVSALLIAAAVALAHHGPNDVLLDDAAKKQPPVPFSHEKHSKLVNDKCDTCHHTQKGLTSESQGVKKCSECHLDPKDKAPSMREMSLTKNPFHIRCIACHKEQKKGPTACNGCHLKKS